MDKKQLDILEKAFSAQIYSAIDHGFGVIQTESKVAKQLCDDVYLAKVIF